MSSRGEHKRDEKERGRGERARERRPRSHRDEQRRRRSSRSRSPRDRRAPDRRDYRRDTEPHHHREAARTREVREQPPAQADDPEEGEETEAVGEDAQAMMATMGMAAFASTKGKHVTGNQDGAANVKKSRTWRQYMNRRGGFNRPLDKIR